MPRANLLAARAQDDHGAQQRDAAAEIFDEIERGIVRPVHVLEDEHRGLAGVLQRVQQRRKQPFGSGGLVEQVADGRIEPTHHIVEGTERAWREEGLAPPPQDLGACLGAAGKVLQEHGFADAGFALDKHCVAVSGSRLPGGRRQGIEQLVSLKQHCASPPPDGATGQQNAHRRASCPRAEQTRCIGSTTALARLRANLACVARCRALQAGEQRWAISCVVNARGYRYGGAASGP